MTTSIMPAALRHRNPSAMGLGKSAKLFGATRETVLRDGHQNTIATFPTMVDGAGAMFHLLRTGSYHGMTIYSALYRWGGGETLAKKGQAAKARERTDAYADRIERLSRFRRGDKVTADWLEDPVRAIEFGKAMAHHEAGMEYPMTDAQWAEAHGEFLTVMAGGHIALDTKKPTPVLAPLELLTSRLGERRVPGSGTNQFIGDALKEISGRRLADETAH